MSAVIVSKDVDSKFRLVMVASQRAKQLQHGAQARVEVRTRKTARVALHEVLAGAVSWQVNREDEAVAEAEVEA